MSLYSRPRPQQPTATQSQQQRPLQPTPQPAVSPAVRYPQSNGVVLSATARQELLGKGLRLDENARISRNLKYNGPVYLQNDTSVVHLTIDAYSYINHHSFFVASSIGRYTSIAHCVECGLGIHDVHGASMSNALCYLSPFAFYTGGTVNRITRVERERSEIVNLGRIGNDVWIGSHVLIVGDVTIGDGAVIGAGSVITRDVPPYAIVAGAGGGKNSERIIKGYRFRDEQISDLLEIKWWQYDVPKYLLSGHKLPLNDITGFLSFMRNEGPEVLTKIPENWQLVIPQDPDTVQVVPVAADYEIGPFMPDEVRFNPEMYF